MFLVSGVDLVVASCRAGALAALPSLNARTTAIFDEWLTRIGQELGDAPAPPGAAPYAVNLIVHPTNPRLDADLEVCVQHQVPLIIAAVGNPAPVIARVKGYGGLVFSDAASVKHARRAAESGVDGLILLCAGAGGNTGWLNPFAFVAEVRRFFQGPLVLAGGISRGQHIHVAREMGADLAMAGTSFIATSESLAVDAYRQMLVESNADDIVLSADVTGIPANFLRRSLEGFIKPKDAGGKFDLGKELQDHARVARHLGGRSRRRRRRSRRAGGRSRRALPRRAARLRAPESGQHRLHHLIGEVLTMHPRLAGARRVPDAHPVERAQERARGQRRRWHGEASVLHPGLDGPAKEQLVVPALLHQRVERGADLGAGLAEAMELETAGRGCAGR